MTYFSRSSLLRLTRSKVKSELEISSLTHDLRSRRLRIPTDSAGSLNKNHFASWAPQARLGPERRRIQCGTTPTVKPSLNPIDLAGKRCRRCRPVSMVIGGRRVPTPPEPPSTLFSVADETEAAYAAQGEEPTGVENRQKRLPARIIQNRQKRLPGRPCKVPFFEPRKI